MPPVSQESDHFPLYGRVNIVLYVYGGCIGERFLESLGRLGRLAFYNPSLSNKVVEKFPGILTERAALARLICRSSEYLSPL